MQCYPSGSKENSACKNVEVTDCAGNMLVPTSNVKALLESFTLEGKERYALSDIQGSMKKVVKFKNRSRDAETLEETVCHSVHTSIYDIRNKVLIISTQESGRGHTLPL